LSDDLSGILKEEKFLTKKEGKGKNKEKSGEKMKKF